MNIGMDSYLTGKDTSRQTEVIEKMLNFFKKDGFRHGHFNLDGTGGFDSYSCGMTGSNAVGAIALARSEDPQKRALAKIFVDHLWNTEPPKGKIPLLRRLGIFSFSPTCVGQFPPLTA